MSVRNKIHKAFPLPGIEFPLAVEVPTASEEGYHCQKKRDATAKKIALLSKSRRSCQSKSNDSFTNIKITCNPSANCALFRIQQYLQREHYALWEVIESEDSYEVPTSTASTTTIDSPSGETGKTSGRTATLTAEDMQKKKNDVKARTTLLLSLPDEHQLRFKTLEQTFNRLQVIIGQLQFMDVEIKHNDLNQKFLASLAPEWLMHTIVWRNKSDLYTMSLNDLYNHFKVYESEVQKKSKPNSQNMDFISSAKHSSRNEDGNTACVPTASTNVPTASASVATISQDTTCTYIASQSSGSQIKFKDINQIDEDDMEEMDIKWNMALLSMRADKFWKKTGKKISIQGSDVAGFDKSKVECFNCHKMGHFARECRAPRSQDRGRRDNYKQGYKAEEQAPKALMAIDVVGWDWSYMANDEEDYALVADEVAPTEFALMANTSAERLAQVESRLVEYKEREFKYCEKIKTLEFRNRSNNECIDILKKKTETFKQEKEGVDGKLASLLTASKNLDNLIESQRSDKNKDGLGYSVVPPPPAQLYSSPKKDLSWTGLLEFTDDTVTDYSRPSPTVESTSGDDQNRNPSVFENVASPIIPKPFIKFVKPKDTQSKSKTDETKTPKKPPVKYAEKYRKPNKKPNVRGNQRNWNNLKSQQLGPDFVMKKKACFNCGDFNHLTYDCRKRVKKSFTPKPVAHRPYRPLVRPVRTNMNDARPNRTSFNKQAHSYANRPFHRTSAVRSHYKAPWVPTVNRNFPPVNRKFSTGSRNFPTANRKFPTASRKIPACSSKCSTTDMGMKGKAIKPLAKFEEKGDEGYFIGYLMSSKAFRVFNKRTRRVEEILHVEFLENKAIEKGAGPNWLFDIESLTKSMNYMPVDAGIISTNISGTKDATSQEVKKNVSSLRCIALHNWAHDALLESSSSKPQDHCSTEVPKGSRNPNPTASTSNLPADPIEILTNVWTLVGCHIGVRPIGTKWVLKNKKDERGIVIRNKAMLVAQGHTQEEGIDYDEVFAPVVRIEAIRLFLAHASFMGFTVYQMEVKSALLYGTIDEEVYVMQPPGFQDPEFLTKVYKVEKAMYGLHQAPRA
nr:copia protein [Tanacetum cinerariifolium]